MAQLYAAVFPQQVRPRGRELKKEEEQDKEQDNCVGAGSSRDLS